MILRRGCDSVVIGQEPRADIRLGKSRQSSAATGDSGHAGQVGRLRQLPDGLGGPADVAPRPWPHRMLDRGPAWPHPWAMIRPIRARLGAGLLGLALLLPLAAAAPAGATAADFPAGFTGYHTYAEMVADVSADGGRPSGHRPEGRDRDELPGPDDLGGQDQRQRRGRRERARGPVRRPDPRRRAHGPRDDPPDHALAGGRLRQRTPGSRTS